MSKIIFILVTAALMAGCTSKQLKTVSDIDSALNTSILIEETKDTPLIKSEKRLVKNTLQGARGTILEQEAEKKSLQADVKRQSGFARIGKWTLAIVAGVVGFFILILVVKLYIRVQTGGAVRL